MYFLGESQEGLGVSLLHLATLNSEATFHDILPLDLEVPAEALCLTGDMVTANKALACFDSDNIRGSSKKLICDELKLLYDDYKLSPLCWMLLAPLRKLLDQLQVGSPGRIEGAEYKYLQYYSSQVVPGDNDTSVIMEANREFASCHLLVPDAHSCFSKLVRLVDSTICRTSVQTRAQKMSVFLKAAHRKQGAQCLVSAMVRARFSIDDFELIPAGISLALYDVVRSCRANPPHEWPREAYGLIGRSDLTMLADLAHKNYDTVYATPGGKRLKVFWPRAYETLLFGRPRRDSVIHSSYHNMAQIDEYDGYFPVSVVFTHFNYLLICV